jgi:sugar-specific transcriptional regulator TrmB
MIVEKAFLDKLKEFGLNSYESKLWTALLSRGKSTAGELADISGVPRSRSYDVLEGLEKKGFIAMKNAKPIEYVAVAPSKVLDKMKTKLTLRSKEQIEQLELLHQSKILDELNNLHSKGMETIELTELSGMINGRENIMNHLLMLFKTATKSIDIVLTQKSLLDIIEMHSKELEKAKKRGVKINIAAKLDKNGKNQLKKHSKNLKVKDVDFHTRFCIVDNQEMLFMLVDDAEVHKNYDSAVWMNSPYFASALSNMLESY